VPTIRIVRRGWQTPAREVGRVRIVAVVTFAVGVPEEDVAVKQVGAVCNRT